MRMRTLVLCCFLGIGLCALLLVLGCTAVKEELGLIPPGGEEGMTSEEEEWGETEMEPRVVSYSEDIQPILNGNCTRCHGRRRQEKNLNMMSHSTLMSRNVITSGDAEGSPLYQKVTLEGPGAMPPQGGPLSDEEIDKIKNWINAGAQDN